MLTPFAFIRCLIGVVVREKLYDEEDDVVSRLCFSGRLWSFVPYSVVGFELLAGCAGLFFSAVCRRL